jgi:diguanylate cyclase (GGDEF)-like protein/hemerythrin-like metal-binding protein
MSSITQQDTLALLRDQAQSSSEPIAILDHAGELAFVNDLMQQAVPGEQFTPKVRQHLTGESGRRFYRIDKDTASDGQDRQLFAISLAGYHIVTLIEGSDDPRIERLKVQLEEARRRSITDPLTGLWNRNQFEEIVRVEVPRAMRYSQPACLLILDIDHFKNVNDHYGHALGDQVLVGFSKLLSEQIRTVDSLFRWGGEEFVILLPNTSLSAARFIADRLRILISEADFAPLPKVTVSIGAAELEQNEDAEGWFQRSDKALYEAKTQGRDQVVCARLDPALVIGGSDDENPVLLPWKSSYESGHPLIDQQHKELFRLGNQLITASLSQDTQREEFLSLATELIDHVAQHFKDEEAILADIGYAELEQHHRAHSGLLARAKKLRDQAETGTTTTRDVIHFLANNVVKQHMVKADMAFFPQLTRLSAPVR